MSTLSKTEGARRPGGRTADITARVQAAALELLIEGGPPLCTYNAVASRAKVDRSTLYRRYPDRWDMMIDAFMARAGADVMPDLCGCFAKDFASVLRRLADILESPVGPALMGVTAGLRARSGTDYSRAYFDQRMAQLAPMFDGAIERGELRADVDREALFTVAAGAIYFRIFIAGRGVDEEFIHQLVAGTCWLYCSPSFAAKVSLPARMA